MMIRRLVSGIMICIGAMFLASYDLSAQRNGDYESVRIAAIRLQQENDSLRMELRKYQSSTEFSSWDALSGLDPDVDVDGFSGFGNVLSGSDRELMSQIYKACPSIGGIGYDKSIREQIENFTERRRKTMSFALARYREYYPRFSGIFKSYGIPEDVAALVIVESAVSVKALSPVGAAGMWQLMPETALRFGLRVDDEIDERYDPVASCQAAARYMKSMHAQFGNWILAVAAYNCGPGNVRRALSRAGANAGLWDVVRYLPLETRGYVPAFVAARYVLYYANELEFIQRKVAKPLPYRVKITGGVHVASLCEDMGITVQSFRDANPHIKNTVDVLPGCNVYLSESSYRKIKNSK